MEVDAVEFKNTTHYMKVNALRKESESIHSFEIDHELVGKFLYDLENQRLYKVVRVKRQWWWGWYISVLIEHNGSHGFIWWENISSSCDVVAKHVEKVRKKFIISGNYYR